MLKNQIRSATKEDYFYHRKIRAFKSNYVLMIKKQNTAIYCSRKTKVKELVKKYGINPNFLIFGWDSQNKRYDLYKIEYFL